MPKEETQSSYSIVLQLVRMFLTYFIVFKSLLVYEKPHELRDGHGRVSVIELDRNLVRKLREISDFAF